LAALVEALRCLPGVGPKSAQRIAFHLLKRNRAGARHLAESLKTAMDRIGHCQRCRTFSEDEVCSICASPKRESASLCVVESAVDVLILEQATAYRGMYFVLQGHLSPLDGLGPKELGLDVLVARIAEGEVNELIIATNPTVEGEATAHYLAQLAHAGGIKATRLAHGVPIGGELEYIDHGTLAHAFGSRVSI